ncbi:hypothetical protein SKAU_G00335180 [Synaphobranchus kaupii]|uniref:Uncharacterized protein n=1 Tax=Synaphobranchus kaupii TaxID=118154 RepID=A0A9Q1EM28_SYNKA|nr:hypothetical protein SKAU_G00335180 [Synaphobranchus kaupii]
MPSVGKEKDRLTSCSRAFVLFADIHSRVTREARAVRNGGSATPPLRPRLRQGDPGENGRAETRAFSGGAPDASPASPDGRMDERAGAGNSGRRLVSFTPSRSLKGGEKTD